MTERRSDQITGVLSCYDRMLIQGTLPGLCFAEGMTGYLYAHHIRVFDYAQWAQTLRENAERLAAENGGEMGNRLNLRIEGTRIKHTMGPVSIKMYDKFGLILRIETTVNNVSFFQHYRKVEQRDGRTATQWAPMKKSIYSLPALREVLQAANRRYLEFLSTLDDPTAGIDRLQKITEPVRENERSYPGLNFFSAQDQTLIETQARGEFNLRGFQNKRLRAHLSEKTSG
ncbi:MAG: hypothetical protein WB763_19955 [Terriglobia bacterium]